MAQASFLEFINKMGKVTRRYYDQTEVLYAYNTSGELIKATDEDKKSEEYTYDKNGNLLTLKQKDGTVITYTYELIRICFPSRMPHLPMTRSTGLSR